MEIAQLTFSPLSSESKRSYKEKGRYHLNNIVGYIPPKSGPLARKKNTRRFTKSKRK
jgi:deoxycytidine triphosphate deaminase